MATRFLLAVSALTFGGDAQHSAASLDAPAHLSRDALEEVGFDWSAQGLRLYANRPSGSAYAQPRHLQATTCSASTANGVWSGQPPELNTQSMCGYFYWTGSWGDARTVYASTSWYLTCNTGFYLRPGTSAYGTCTGGKTCSYDPNQAYQGSCTHVCTYQYSSSYGFSYPNGICDACYPPAAANAINPPFATGTATYGWTCAKGYYGAPVYRTCQGDGSWSGGAISCAACAGNAAPANGQLVKPSADQYDYSCNPGYFNPYGDTLISQRCDSTTGAMSPAGTVSCSACTYDGRSGQYCTGVDTRRPCPGGTYGAPGALLSSPSCSGSCLTGYYCPQGSTSNTAYACGGPDKYCPSGSGSPVSVDPGYFSTPATGPATTRTGQALCPSGRTCAGGVILPGIDLSLDCPNGVMSMIIPESTTGVSVGTPLEYTTPGTGATAMGASYSVVSFSKQDATCALSQAMFGWSPVSIVGTVGVSSVVMASPLVYANCQNGFTMGVSVVRADSASSAASGYGPIAATCQVAVTVLQVAKPPVITDCNDRAVNERSVAGTSVGLPLGATNPNIGTSLLYFINYTLSNNAPASVGMCDGQIRVLRPFRWQDVQSFRVFLTIVNEGSAIGIGSSSATCALTVFVRQVPQPPVLGVTVFYIAELKDVGTLVGNVMATDPNNFTIVSYSFVNRETPLDAFTILPDGNITVAARVDSLALLKNLWTYSVNASNGLASALTTVQINVLPVPRPPVVYAQTITVREDIAAGVLITPGLTATHPQLLNLSFALTPPDGLFNVTQDGFVFRRPGTVIDYYSYEPSGFKITAQTIQVTDTLGQTTAAALTVQLLEVNKPPVFGFFSYNYTVDELTPFGSLVASGAAAPHATDPNHGDGLAMRIVGADPAIGNRTFAIEPASGEISIGAAVSVTGGVLMYDRSLTFPRPFTFRVDLQVRDNGNPVLTGAAVAWIRIVNIKPRVAFPPAHAGGVYNLPGAPAAGLSVENMSALTWAPVPSSSLRWSMVADGTAEGDTAFVIDPATGEVSVANITYCITSGGGGGGPANGTGSGGGGCTATASGPPRFNYNTRSVYTCAVTVTNLQDSTATTSTLTIYLAHVNRPPTFTANPTFFAKASENATIGSPLLRYVADPDLALNVGENMTFALLGGNTDGTFALNPVTGELSVAFAFANAFRAPPNGPGWFNLSIGVTDAGKDGPAYSARCWVYINVTDNNVRPWFAAPQYRLSVQELVPVGTMLGYVFGTDLEDSQHLTYALSPRGGSVNLAFPFNATTVAGGATPVAHNRAMILTASDGPLDWNALYKYYNATLTACDDHPTMPLCASVPVDIDVLWVPRPPFFDLVNRAPASKVFTIAVNEYSGPGTNVSTAGGLLASSKDPWRRNTIRYDWVDPGTNNSVLFSVDQHTAMVTVAGGVVPSSLDVNKQMSFYMTLRATDDNVPALTDVARVVINIVDVNNAAIFDSLYSPDNTTRIARFRVNETAAVGTVIGYVRFTDQDRYNPLWGQVNYALVPSADTPLFTIDARTGALTVGATGLDFWDQTSFTFTVSVTDGDFAAPITVTTSVSVDLVQQNTVRIAGFFVGAGMPPAMAVNVSGSAYALSHSGHDALVTTDNSTQGGVPLRLFVRGSGFGPTARRASVAYSVWATYGPTGTEYSAGAPCLVEVRNSLLSCPLAAGIGRDHVWRVTVMTPNPPATGQAVWTSPLSVPKTGYFPPSVISVYRVGGNPSDVTTQTMPTAGTASLAVTARNVGPTGGIVVLKYGNMQRDGSLLYITAACTWVASQSALACPSVEGVGTNLSFVVNVGVQDSAPFTASPVRYASPAITSVTTAPALLNTDGRDGEGAITVIGTNFGPPSTIPTLSYSKDFANASWYPVFVTGKCSMPAAGRHTTFVCPSAPGIGANLRVMLEVGGQASPATSGGAGQGISYLPPVITDLLGQGRDLASTTGGQEILLYGTQLGPATPVNGAGLPVASFLQPAARYGRLPAVPGTHLKYTAAQCAVTQQHTLIRCLTVPGTGRDLVWEVNVGGQWSAVYTNKSSSYHPPIVASYSGEGSHLARTQGNQSVVIDGKHFGPQGTRIDLATYGSDENSTTFTAWNCSLLIPHTDILCFTTVGAGAGLKWKVTIDGQLSVTPATDYGPPIISSFSGPGATDASTDGGDDVFINGAFLSVQRFLDKVTYGPSGSEFLATGSCSVSVPHSQVRCRTLPGTGRRLSWFLTVGGQTSSLGTAATSYALPRVTALSPAVGQTDGLTIVVNGTNLGVCDPSSPVACTPPAISIKFNDGTAGAPPAQSELDAHWAAVAAGDTASYRPSVLAWLGRMQTLLPSNLLWWARSTHGLEVALPQGYGTDRELIVVVGGVLSNIARFNYSRPAIANIAPDRQQVPLGYLRVQVDGASFCNILVHPGCGDILVDGESFLGNLMLDPATNASLWRHSFLTFYIADPSQGSKAKTLVVRVGGQDSAPRSFIKPVPNVNSAITQLPFFGVDTLGGETFAVSGVQDITGEAIRIFIGPRECTNVSRAVDNGRPVTDPSASFKLTCTIPPGIGTTNVVKITSETGNSSLGTAMVVQYAGPRIDDVTIDTAFWSAADFAQGLSAQRNLRAVTGAAPAASVTGRDGSAGRALAVASGIPTLGAIVRLHGRYFGLPETGGDPLVVSALRYAGVPMPNSTAFPQQRHMELNGLILNRTDDQLVVLLTSGDGRGHAINFTVGTQTATTPLDFSAPTIAALEPAHGSTAGGASLVLSGHNFGVSPLVLDSRAGLWTAPPYVTIGTRRCAITSGLPHVNHSSLTCTLPPGYGANLPVRLWVNGQLDTAAPLTTFSYDAPHVTDVAPSHGPTSGRGRGTFLDAARIFLSAGDRIVMVLRGSNFGRSGALAFEPTEASGPLTLRVPVDPTDVLPVAAWAYLLAQAGGNASAVAGMTLSDAQMAAFTAQSNASIVGGGDDLSTEPAFRDTARMWTDGLIAFLMPEGFGGRLTVNASVGGQAGQTDAWFDYDAPVITRVVRKNYDDESLHNCEVNTTALSPVGLAASRRGVQPRVKAFYPGCYPTGGGYTLMILGESLGPQARLGAATTVTVGGRICQPTTEVKVVNGTRVTNDHTHVFCTAPAGAGELLPVIVTVGSLASPVTNDTLFTYDPPIISGFSPNNPDARGRDAGIAKLSIKGANFANSWSPTRVTINGAECGGATWETSTFVTCGPAADVVGAKNVTLFTANRTAPAIVWDVEEELVYTCKKAFYGLEGEVCLPCPQGGACPGDERFVDLVNSTHGFWRTNWTVGSEEAGSFCAPERRLSRVAAGCPSMQPCEPVDSCLGNNTCAYGYDGPRCINCLAGKFYRVNGECIKCPDNLVLIYVFLALALAAAGGFAYFLNKKNVSLALIAIGVDYFQIVSMFARARIMWPPELKQLFQILSVFNLNVEIVAPECLNPGISYHLKWMFIEGLPLLLITCFVLIHVLKVLYKVACTSKRKSQLNAHLPTLVGTIIVVFRLLYLYLTKTSMDALSCLATTPPEFKDKEKTIAILYMAGQIDYPCWQGWHLVLFPLGLCFLLLYSIVLPLAALWHLRRNRDAVKTDQILRCRGTGNDELSNPRYYRWRKMWAKLYQHYRPGKWYWEGAIVARKFLIALCSLMFRQVGAYQLAMCLLVLFVAFVLQTQHNPYITHENKQGVIDEHLAKALAGDKLHATIESDMRATEKKNTRKRQKQNLFENLVSAKGKDTSTMVVLFVFDANTVESILLASAAMVNLAGVMLDSKRFAGDNLAVNRAEYTGIALGTVVLISLTIAYYVLCIFLELMTVFAPSRMPVIVGCLGICFRSFSARKLQEAAIKARKGGVGRPSASGPASDMMVNPYMMKQQQGDPAFTAGGLVDPTQIAGISAPTTAFWGAVQGSYGRMADMLRSLQEEMRDMKRELDERRGAGSGGPGLGTSRMRTQFRPMLRAVEDPGAHDAESMASLSVNPLLVSSRSAGGGASGGGTHVAGLNSFASSKRPVALKMNTARRRPAGGLDAAASSAGGDGADEDVGGP